MNRRRYLRTVAAGGTVTGIAGCVGGQTDSTPTDDGPDLTPSPNVKLPMPDEVRADPEVLPYPAWGQQIPSVTLPAPLQDREVTTTGFDTPLALTFIYTNCQTACPLLTQALTRAQDEAAEGGYADQVNFAEITFDPERDTAERLREYADERNVNLDDDNWYFLRPPTVARAKQVVNDQFGLGFQRTTPQEMDQYMFAHSSLILLVNSDSYVERTYGGGQEAMQTLATDMNELQKL